MIIPLLAFFLPFNQDSAPPDDRPLHTLSLEGVEARFDRFEVAGSDERRVRFVISAYRSRSEWVFRYVGSAGRIDFTLNVNHRDLHLSGMRLILPENSNGSTRIALPFGGPLLNCFDNGEEVFRQLIVSVVHGQIEGVTETDFPACRISYRRPTLNRIGRVYRIGE